MIHGFASSTPLWMTHHHGRANSCGAFQDIQKTESESGEGRCGNQEQTRRAGFAGFANLAGSGCCSFDRGTHAALFADRSRMEQRAEFRGQMHEIRHDIRDLMGTVEGGQLTTEQQETFDGYVQKIVDLREEYGIHSWRGANAEHVAERILNRFGVEPAPVCCCQHEETAAEPPAGEVAEPVSETTEVSATTEVAETDEAVTEATDEVAETAPEETKVIDAAALSALVDKLASTIVDAESLIDELAKAIG